MSTRQIHVFISHSWAYSGHYNTLSNWIFGQNWSVGQASLNLRNFSVPKDDPIHNAPTVKKLREAIYTKISRCHVVVIPSGIYATYSKWIKEEIEAANYYGKPIVSVSPWGQQKKSIEVESNATKSVGWNSDPIVKAIWQCYRDN